MNNQQTFQNLPPGKIRVAIVGATGYTGEELIKILLHHPRVKITSLSAKIDEPSLPIRKIYPFLKSRLALNCKQPDLKEISTRANIIFLAVPHTVALKMVPFFSGRDKYVIDLSADFRFDSAKVYEKWYPAKHNSPRLLKKAVYGLPELYRARIKTARLVANPGCYPTSVILGCAPLLKTGLVANRVIIVDAKTGFSGGGREFVARYVPQNKENLKAYNVAAHRHTPEMEQELTKLSNSPRKVLFVPHLIPVERGILSTIYLPLKHSMSCNELRKTFRQFYAREPFVRVLAKLPETKNVVGTNYCDLGVVTEPSGKYAIVFAAIDNLIKGAAGQSVQNMNLMLGFAETEGLL